MLYKLKLKRPNANQSSLMTEFMKNGVQFKLYSGKTIQTKNWSSSKQMVLSGEENYTLINKYLDMRHYKLDFFALTRYPHPKYQ